MEALFQLNEVISVVCCSDEHDEFGQSLALLLLPGFSAAVGGKKKNIRGERKESTTSSLQAF